MVAVTVPGGADTRTARPAKGRWSTYSMRTKSVTNQGHTSEPMAMAMSMPGRGAQVPAARPSVVVVVMVKGKANKALVMVMVMVVEVLAPVVVGALPMVIALVVVAIL